MNKLDFSLAIFDLDLTLWDGKQLYKETRYILDTLKKQGIILYVASFHLYADRCCKKLGISHYFEDIYFGRDRKKSDMINDIMSRHKNINRHKVVFFDDNFDNLIDVSTHNSIKTIHINKNTGVTWNNIPKQLVAFESFPIVFKNKTIHTYNTRSNKKQFIFEFDDPQKQQEWNNTAAMYNWQPDNMVYC